jgi:hypothetical protein
MCAATPGLYRLSRQHDLTVNQWLVAAQALFATTALFIIDHRGGTGQHPLPFRDSGGLAMIPVRGGDAIAF